MVHKHLSNASDLADLAKSDDLLGEGRALRKRVFARLRQRAWRMNKESKA